MQLPAPSRPSLAALLSPGSRLTLFRSSWHVSTPSCVPYSSLTTPTVDWRDRLVVPQAVAAAGVLQQQRGVRPQSETHFLSKETFEGLGLARDVSAALERAGFIRPARAQALAAGPLLDGKDVILAAETGSGKTLAYLGPLFTKLLANRRPKLAARLISATPGALVLCPNLPLCDQVVTMANQLTDATGLPLLSTARISSTQPPPRQPPDITVATPAGLIYASDNYGSSYGPDWTKDGIVGRIHHIVFDEADLLLSGSFQKDVARIVQVLQDADRARKISATCVELGVSEEQYRALPVHLRRAGIEGGAAAMRAAGLKPKHLSGSTLSARMATVPEMVWDDEPEAESSPQSAAERSSSPVSTSQPATKPYWRRQYIFAAATMPTGEVGKSVGADLKRIVPNAIWLSGAALHKAQHAVTHTWVPVQDDSWAAALQAAVAGHQGSGLRRTLVFAADVAAADEAAEQLQRAGMHPLVYHRKIPAEERAQALRLMAASKECTIVCTDAAARGLDIPLVTHVVQATFAASAIDFLHRVGRTGRAGNAGHVTSLYLPQQAMLAEAIQAEIEAGRPIEGTFSRNRSFRSKYKRYGRFVPRGEVVNAL